MQKKVDSQIKKYQYSVCGSYLNDESAIDVNKKTAATNGNGNSGTTTNGPKEFTRMLNSKVDKDDHREALKNKENKIQTAYKMTLTLSDLVL